MFRSSISRNRPQRTCDCDCVDNGFIIDNAICSTIRPPTTALAQFLRTFCGWRFDLWPLTPHPVRRLPSPVTVGVARFVGELRNGFVIRINNPNDYFVLQKLYLLNWYLSFRGARARACHVHRSLTRSFSDIYLFIVTVAAAAVWLLFDGNNNTNNNSNKINV